MSYALQSRPRVVRSRAPRMMRAGALGDTATDVRSAVDVIAGLISNPDATLRARGPALVQAADRHVMTPMMDRLAQSMAPYIYKYVLPPLSVLYVLGGISAYYSFQAASNTRRSSVKANRRRQRSSRRSSRRR